MKPIEDELQARIPTIKTIEDQIRENQAGFALVFLGVMLVFLSVVVQQNASNWFSVGGGCSFLVGLYLIFKRDQNTNNVTFQILLQRNKEYEEKIHTLELEISRSQQDIESAKRELSTASENTNTQTRIAEQKETFLNALTDEVATLKNDLQVKQNRIAELTQQLELVAASSDPQALVNARSFAISEALGELYKLSYGRTEAVSSMDVIEMLYSKGLLTSDHYQDILIRHNKFRPQSDD